MDTSIGAVVDMSMALQQHNTASEAQSSVLRQTLDQQQGQMDKLMSSVNPEPKLATEGLVGTRLHTTA